MNNYLLSFTCPNCHRDIVHICLSDTITLWPISLIACSYLLIALEQIYYDTSPLQQLITNTCD